MGCTTQSKLIEMTQGDTLQVTVVQIFNSTLDEPYDLTNHTAELAVVSPGLTDAVICVEGVIGGSAQLGVILFEFSQSESDLLTPGTYDGVITVEIDGKEATVVGSVRYRINAKVDCPVL